MRRASGGKSPDELKQEMDDYRGSVNAHFQHSAALLQQMTDQYRSIYTHMAHGAVELCGDENESAPLEELKRLSVALNEAAALPAGEGGIASAPAQAGSEQSNV